MKRHVLILGAGFGGLELATRLSETVSDAVDVSLLDRNNSFSSRREAIRLATLGDKPQRKLATD